MATSEMGIGSALSEVPLGEMIRSMAMAVADAQFKLDKSSLMVAEFMSGRYPLRDEATGQIVRSGASAGQGSGEPVMVDSRIQFGYEVKKGERIPRMVSLMELGFVPNFYQFVDTVLEVRIALRASRSGPAIDPATGRAASATIASGAESSGWSGVRAGGSGISLSSTPIDAGYASAYGFKLELASLFKTKLVPVPPPVALEERLRLLLQESKESASEEQAK